MEEMEQREIKFRAWDTKNKKWLEFVPPEEYMLDSDEWSSPDYGDMEESMLFYPHNPIGPTFEGRIIYTQFTGLKDKNKKDIYEGDIILEKWKENNPYGYFPDEWREKKNKYIVKYNPPSFIFDSPIYHEQRCIEDWSRKIIGNIFENPKLLKL